jgi:hypothetical protein
MWLASQFCPISCYCADHSQPSYNLHFINAEWPLSYFMVWDSPSVNETLPQSLKKSYVSKKCLYFNKTSFHDFVPFAVISHFYYWYLVSSWNPTITKDSNVPFKNKKWDAAVNATHLLIRLSIKCHFFAVLNLCYVTVDTVQTSISIQYNVFFATAAFKNHLEWEEIVKFKTITTDIKNILYLCSLTIMTDKLNSMFCIVHV